MTCAREGDAGDRRVIDVDRVKTRDAIDRVVNPSFNEGDATQRDARNGDTGNRQGRCRGPPRANPRYYTDDRDRWKPLIHCPV